MWSSWDVGADSSGVPDSAEIALGNFALCVGFCLPWGRLDGSSAGPVRGQDRTLGAMEFTASPKPQLSSRANAFSIAALMSSGGSKEKEGTENTIKPLGKSGCLNVRCGQRRGAHPSVPLSPACGRLLRVAAFPSLLEAASDPWVRGPTLGVGESFLFRPNFLSVFPDSRFRVLSLR